MDNLKENLLKKIRDGQVSMRPRYYFVLKVAALSAIAAAILVVSVFILNFILFSIRINSQGTLIGFGPRGVFAFLAFFPWVLLLIDTALVFALQWLIREFRFGYRIPVAYVLAGLVLGTLVFGFLLDRGTGFNDELLRRSDRDELFRPANIFYGQVRRMPPPRNGICVCSILNIDKNMLQVKDVRSGSLVTVILPLNDLRATTSGLVVGDTVLIAGDGDKDNDEDDVVIRAFGVRKVPSHAPETQEIEN
ncbi:MAG: hypothetical protein JWL87_143 [Candidatus Adlerbacteria bacterium]|nr:hypothetical protein [Candidatus Adlerbacteria bacterium]